MKDKDLEFDFYIGGNESNQEEFEDVFSNSSANGNGSGDEISLSSFAGGAHSVYSKKSHSFFGKLKSWWKGRKGWQKGLMISATSFLLVFVIAFSVLWGTGILSLLNYNYNDITEDTEELGFENVLNENIVNIYDEWFIGYSKILLISLFLVLIHEISIRLRVIRTV